MRRFFIITILVGLIFTPMFIEGASWKGILGKMKTNYSTLQTKVQDMKFQGVMLMKTPEGKDMETNFTYYRKDKKFRQEIEIKVPGMEGGMKQIVVYDGKKGYVFSPMGEKRELKDYETNQYEPPVDWWTDLPKDAVIKGTEKVDGKTCYVVQAQEENTVTKIWIDKNNYVPVKVENIEGEHKSVIKFLEFKTTPQGGKVPYKIEFYDNGKLAATYMVKSIQYNVGLSDDLFNPANVKTGSMEDLMKKMMQGR
mgnify:CR=1 FL=1